MVWPFSDSNDDPVKKLDPELRTFLENEAPKAHSQNRSRATVRPQAPVSIAVDEPRTPRIEDISDNEVPKAPALSQFQDGRYAHLWKTYKQNDESVAMSDGEILQNLTRSFQRRKQQISIAALENCAFEAIADQDCWRNGSFSQKLWLCREETQALDRCTQLQTKFLQALGYLADEKRPQEVDDRIQMHADRLYQQMLSHEKTIKAAKEQGLPPPKFKPVMSKENLAKVLGVQASGYLETAEEAEVMASNQDLSHIPEKRREKYSKAVASMTPDERLIEEAVNVANLKNTTGLAKDYQQYVGQRKFDEGRRRESGSLTLAERIRSWWSNKQE